MQCTYLKMKRTLLLLTVVVSVNLVSSEPCSRKESLDISNGESFANGSIIHNGIEYTAETSYEMEEDGVLKRLGCPCIERKCLWKCCGEGNAYHDFVCGPTTEDYVNPFSPPVYKDSELLNVSAQAHFFYMYSALCTDRYLVDSGVPDEFIYLQEDGILHETTQGRFQTHEVTQYCLDMATDNQTGARLVAVICYPESSTDDSSVLYIAYAVGLLLSTPFLLATLLVYSLVPELRNLHGLCLMAYCAGLIVAYPVLAYLKLHTGQVGVNMTGCLIIAFVVYYSFQTSFFWLNIMCFDIWRTFSGYRRGSMSKRRERRRFMLYGLYAWGVPLALTAGTAAMQFSDSLPQTVVRPNFGQQRCWFDNWLSELAYFYSPVLVLVLCNIVLFSVTAHRIHSIRQETAILKSAESSRSDKLKREKQRFALYLKLFVVMGVNWSVELLSFAAGGSNWYWVVIDFSNIMLGFFIFFMFVWKKRVRDLVATRLGWRGVRGAGAGAGTSSAVTDDTRLSEDALRMNTLR